jgi:hypothetical protein
MTRRRFSPSAAFVLNLAVCHCLSGCDYDGDPPTVENRAARIQRIGEPDGGPGVIPPAATDHVTGSPVAATLKLEPGRATPGDELVLTVSLDIDPLWEVGKLENNGGPAATRIELKTSDDITTESEWQAPQPTRSIAADGHSVYVDEAVFRRNLRAKPGASTGSIPIECRVHYQACNDRQCLQPAAIDLKVEAIVSQADMP